MKIIDLLNKIANGEEVPKYIKYYDKLHSKEDTMLCCYANLIYKLDNDIVDLTDEVEILDNEDEEKKLPEKLKWNEKSQHNVVTDNTKKTLEHLLSRSEQLKKSINEIIDYLEKQKKGE